MNVFDVIILFSGATELKFTFDVSTTSSNPIKSGITFNTIGSKPETSTSCIIAFNSTSSLVSKSAAALCGITVFPSSVFFVPMTFGVTSSLTLVGALTIGATFFTSFLTSIAASTCS